MPAILKRQQFNTNESEKMALIVYKCQQFDKDNNE